ncbi:MAG TPA: very short patch repair endonuclease [Emticicia sp.]
MSDYKEDKIKVPRFEEAGGFYTTKQRSRIMSKIKGKNTVPEMSLRKALYAEGVRYRIVNNDLPGRPDIAIRKYKLAVFVDGEFWHGHDWEKKRAKIKTNIEFWIPKIERNIQRDIQNNSKLELLGYKAFRFWSKDIKSNLESCVQEILIYISKQKMPY